MELTVIMTTAVEDQDGNRLGHSVMWVEKDVVVPPRLGDTVLLELPGVDLLCVVRRFVWYTHLDSALMELDTTPTSFTRSEWSELATKMGWEGKHPMSDEVRRERLRAGLDARGKHGAQPIDLPPPG